MQKSAGLTFYQSPIMAAFPELVHGFFTRRGGVSLPPYDSLNLSLSVGDRREAVLGNRQQVQRALGLTCLADAHQVHGRSEAVITENPTGPKGEPATADILFTDRPGVGLLIKQADCQAVILYDPHQSVVANVHCGWRGQVHDVLGSAVARLFSRYGCRPEDLRAAISPSLGPCCAEFRNFHREFPPELWRYEVRPQYFDLWQLSRAQLQAAGIKPENIDLAGLCTRCRATEFFSYRREKITGRQGTVVGLRA
ncbi:MAG: polyphenol oxidase family protein [Deltaproteobacteria bacterium]|nr:polyphenol oxidase family protein [Deltaproteobacteria bacterium]